MIETEPKEPPDPRAFTDDSPNPARDGDLAILCDSLQEQGITEVRVRYSGSGDSGSVEEVEIEPEHACLPSAIEDWLCVMAEDYCPDGYENNDGGYGTLTVYPLLGLATLAHSNCYEDSYPIDTGPVSLPEALQQGLSRQGITRITAVFNGFGDSGQIDDLTVEPEHIEIDGALQDELEDLLLDVLPGGWENNAGGFGDFSVEIATGQVAVDASWRTEEADAHVTRWQWRK
jgi:hypothetical protein